jgi:hypothetical protein
MLSDNKLTFQTEILPIKEEWKNKNRKRELKVKEIRLLYFRNHKSLFVIEAYVCVCASSKKKQNEKLNFFFNFRKRKKRIIRANKSRFKGKNEKKKKNPLYRKKKT